LHNYRIRLECQNKSDADKFNRDLFINSYESAVATFKTLVKGSLDEIIDPYQIELWYGDKIAYKVEHF